MHIYFVAGTKGSMSSMQLRLIEEAKIHCAREHFKAISGENIVYDVVDSYQTLLEKGYAVMSFLLKRAHFPILTLLLVFRISITAVSA